MTNNYEIIITEAFTEKLLDILNRIKQDRPIVADNFKKEILKKIKSLRNMPLRHRQSIYFEDESIRDLIFKGFTVVFEVRTKEVIVFSIVKHQFEP